MIGGGQVTSSVVHYLMSLLDLVALAMRFYIYVHGYPEKPSDFMYMVHRHTTTPPAPHPASTLRDTLDTVSCTYLLLLLLIAVCVCSCVWPGFSCLLCVTQPHRSSPVSYPLAVFGVVEFTVRSKKACYLHAS